MRITFDSPVIPIIIIVAILALIFGISSYFHKKRLEAMNNAAVRMGFSFESKGDRGFIEQLLVFKSFHQGHSQKANNVLKGRRNGWNLTIFDFSYV
ncbi:MAG: hypothetical protein KKF65_06455, partial [Nanoarchaeota archaeon]|nr:hypothetical protein [Nanoarchaeota archaeon]